MRKPTRRTNHITLPALVAMGSSLAAMPVAAIELSDVNVQSRLGQPLRASIAFALAPNEEISNNCVSLKQASSSSGLPGIGNATLSVANGVIKLVGDTAVREPMMAAQIAINCPYSANITREYMLLVDPAIPAYTAVSSTQSAPRETAVAEASATRPNTVRDQSRSRPTTPRQRSVPATKDIALGSKFRVPGGITASEIAARIDARPVGLWPAVFAIVDANPDAFVDGDPNKLKAGSWLTIPTFSVDTTATDSTSSVAVERTTAIDSPEKSASSATTNIDDVSAVDPITTESASSQLESMTADLLPGDSISNDSQTAAANPDSENPYVVTNSNEVVVIPDTALEGPTTTSASPNVATAVAVENSRTPERTPNASQNTATPSWLLWLAGSGVALILGLVLFGRRLRDGRRDAPLAAALPATALPQRRASDTETLETLDLVDYDLSDDSPTDQNPILDADLSIGTGLDAATDVSINVSGDFGFATPDTSNIELPFEPMPVDDMTDMLPTIGTGENSILESEILPDDDDYDMSVIIDATKMPISEEVTERDLKAVVVDTGDDTLVSESYTISEEVDFQILEQDYEDEMTATQALNIEIERAAAELARNIDNEDNEDSGATSMIAALPMADVIELDVTSQMPARNSNTGDDTEKMAAAGEEPTVEMEQPSATDEDRTAVLNIESRKKG